MVSTHLKNIGQIGSFREVGVKIKKNETTTEGLLVAQKNHLNPLDPKTMKNEVLKFYTPKYGFSPLKMKETWVPFISVLRVFPSFSFPSFPLVGTVRYLDFFHALGTEDDLKGPGIATEIVGPPPRNTHLKYRKKWKSVVPAG